MSLQGATQGFTKVLSGTAQYALRAVVQLARGYPGAPMRADDLATAVNVPRNYLSKILHQLVRAGVLSSSRGKHGGFTLSVPPHEIAMLDVVSPFDDVGAQRSCLFGRLECSDEDPCPAHDRWRATAEQLSTFFRETTIADVLSDGTGTAP
ncbi:MAG: Rrf2 family transcriptional regulator [Gemmatimonadota bacterium]|nr:Rrf2 family transcriptional regulator [Gemmatimonadota bacterium]